MIFTKDQQNIIDSRNKNLLVSAGAGSGKTATLVEHIINLIVKDGVKIDEILTLTFTNAAAAEMKQKITLALLKEVEKDRENLFLRAQLNNIAKAYICTTDSFCRAVVSENFHKTDLDPGYSIINSGVALELRKRSLEEVLEEGFATEDEDILFLNKVFKTEEYMAEAIEKLYFYSRSVPFPDKWFEDIVANYDDTMLKLSEKEKEDFLKTLDDTLSLLKSLKKDFKELCGIGSLSPEEEKVGFTGLVNSDIDSLLYTQKNMCLPVFESANSYRKEIFEVDKEKRKNFVSARKDITDKFLKAAGKYSFFSQGSSVDEIHKKAVLALIKYTRLFAKRFKEYKDYSQFAEFSDIAHNTLKILYNEDMTFSEEAKEQQNRFKKIFIDEYQDTNYIQEWIYRAVSGNENLFMVGDIKQSIYKFRQAEPEIFAQKYASFSEVPEADDRLIILSENFRSRPEVLESTNCIFHRIMSKATADCDYNEKIELKPSASFPCFEQQDNRTEINIIYRSGTDEENHDMSTEEKESVVMGEYIKTLISSGFKIKDEKEPEGYRPLRYGDIAILLRSPSSYVNNIIDTLSNMGIPCTSSADSLLSLCTEVQIVSNFIRILDNPLLETELVSVLHSQLYGFDENELALIKIKGYKESKYRYYDHIVKYSLGGENEKLRERICAFLKDVEDMRSLAEKKGIFSLLNKIYYDMDYMNIVKFFPGGDVRCKNLRIFSKLAIDFDHRSPGDLSKFVNYMDAALNDNKLTRANMDSKDGQSVKIMTIHASKGLEYPVVIYAMLGKNINFSDSTEKLLINRTLGINLSMDMPLSLIKKRENTNIPDFLVKKTPKYRKVFSDDIKRDAIAEEMRLIYVAMTRAKEKLIMIGTTKDTDLLVKQEAFSDAMVFDATSPLELVALGLKYIYDEKYKKYFFTKEILSENILPPKKVKVEVGGKLEHTPLPPERLESIKEDIHKRVTYNIAGFNEYIPSVISVTQIKGIKEAIAAGKVPGESKHFHLPSLEKDENNTAVSSAEIGTAYHTILEHITKEKDIESLKELTEKLTAKKLLKKEAASAVDLNSVLAFLNSPLYERIKSSPSVHKETPFTMYVDPAEIYGEKAKREKTTTIIGIIDLYFEEDGELVIVDYKSDKVKDDAFFVQEYLTQLSYYKRALEAATGKKVKQTLIYSLYTQREITIID